MKNSSFIFSAFLALLLSPGQSVASVVTGTGFLISANGFVVTNYHVVKDSNNIRIRDYTGKIHLANLTLKDVANDLAVLKIEGKNFSSLPIKSSTNTKKGMSVFTIGFPNVSVQGNEAKVTEGIISSMSGLQGEPNSYQISVPIQPGNSGGPLIDDSGSVVGVTTAKLSASAMLKQGGHIPENVNYAVKSNYLLELLGTDSNVSGETRVVFSEKIVPLTQRVEVAERSVVFIIVESKEVTTNPPLIGQKCSSSNDCTSTNCYFGTCINKEGSVKAGGTCRTGAECASDLNCLRGICQTLP